MGIHRRSAAANSQVDFQIPITETGLTDPEDIPQLFVGEMFLFRTSTSNA